MKIYKRKTQEGFTIIFVVLLVGIILSMVLTLSLIFIPKITSSIEVKRSASAIYAAESALEWCLYLNRIGSAAQPVMDNGSSYVNGDTGAALVAADCNSSPIKVSGTYQGVTRSFEISF